MFDQRWLDSRKPQFAFLAVCKPAIYISARLQSAGWGFALSPCRSRYAYYSDILVPKLKNAKWIFMLYGDDASRIESFVQRHQLENIEIRKW